MKFLRFARAVRHQMRLAATEIHRRDLLRQVRGGQHLHMEGRITVIHPARLTLGRNVHVGQESYFNCTGGVSIGDYTMISRRVTIYSYDHRFRKADALPFDHEIIERPVTIGRYVWIGMNVSIAPGTVIHDGAILGLGVVASGEIPANAIVVGAKPRIIGYRDKGDTCALDESGRFFIPKNFD